MEFWATMHAMKECEPNQEYLDLGEGQDMRRQQIGQAELERKGNKGES